MRRAPEKQFTGHHMLMLMISFFAVVLIANMTMVYFARHSWTGLVVRNSYVASQQFNTKTEEMDRAAEIGIHIEVGKTELKFTLKNKSGLAVYAKSALLTLGRPSHEGEDLTLTLIAQGSGVFTTRHALAHGQWWGTIAADIPGHEHWNRPVYLLVKD